MKAGTVIINPRIKTFITDNFQIFFETLADRLNLKLLYTTIPKICEIEGEFVMVYNMPHVDYPKEYCDLSDLFRWGGPILFYFRDMHSNQGTCHHALMGKVLDLAKAVFVTQYNYFNDKYIASNEKAWIKTDKLLRFPIFFGPQKRYSSLNGDLSKKKLCCLVPGMVSQNIYSLRHLAWTYNRCVGIKHCGYESRDKGVTGDKWAKALSEYACCLTDCSKYGYLLAKHLEIPASGSLLLTNSCKELTDAGFISGINYINVTEDNYKDVIDDVLGSVGNYQHIALCGRIHVNLNFTLESAVDKMINHLKIMNLV